MIDNRMKATRKPKDIWYAWYPGDYASKTATLTLVEHGAYRVLLDHYYQMHGSVVANATLLLRACRAVDTVEQAAVHAMLARFFIERDGHYHHERADAELEKRALLREKRAAAGSKGGKQKVANATILPAVSNGVCQTQLQSHLRTRTDVSSQSPLSSPPDIQNLVEPLLVLPEGKPLQVVTPSKLISSKVNRGQRWPADAVVPDDWIVEAAASRQRHGRPVIDLVLEAEKFRNYWSAKSGAQASKIDWRATWRNWALNSNGATSNGKGQFGQGRNLSDHPLGIFGQIGDEIRQREIPGGGGSEDHGGIAH